MDSTAIKTAVESAIATHGEIQEADRVAILNSCLDGGVTRDELAAAHELMRSARVTYAKAVQTFNACERDLARAYSIVPPNPVSLEGARHDREAALLAQQSAAAYYEAYQLVEADIKANLGYSSVRAVALAPFEARDVTPTAEQIAAAREALSDAIDAQDAAQDEVAVQRAHLETVPVPGPASTRAESLDYRLAVGAVEIAEAAERKAASRVAVLTALITRMTQKTHADVSV